jgi:hypothetical protein
MSEMELQCVDLPQRYDGERQHRVNMATVERRVIPGPRGVAHRVGDHLRGRAAADRAVVQETSGIRDSGD